MDRVKTNWRFSVHPAGVACLLAAFLFVPVDQLIAVLAAITIHEVAHLVSIRFCRVRDCAVEWTPLGFVAQTSGLAFLSPGKRLVIAGAGLAASGCMAWISHLWLSGYLFGQLFFSANLALLLVNALPVLPLDGGRVLLALFAFLRWEEQARKILICLSYMMATFLTIIGVYSAFAGVFNPTLLVLGPYLAYAARQCSIENRVEWTHSLVQRKRQRPGVYRAEPWIAVGEPDPLALVQILRKSSQEKQVILYRINPTDGSFAGSLTQHQILVNLIGETVNNH